MSAETRFLIAATPGKLFRQKRLQEKALQPTCLSTCCHFVLAFVVVGTGQDCCNCRVDVQPTIRLLVSRLLLSSLLLVSCARL